MAESEGRRHGHRDHQSTHLASPSARRAVARSRHSWPLVAVPAGVMLMTAAALWRSVAVPALVRFPTDVDQHPRYEGTFTGLDLVLHWADTWPMPMLSRSAALVHHQPFVNLVVSNVRGPEHPLELLGAQVTQIVPIVPLAGNLSLGVTIFSYSGQLAIGIHADAEGLDDLDVFVSGMERALEHLAPQQPVWHRSRLSVVQ
jgi:uncharacterized protein DUF1298